MIPNSKDTGVPFWTLQNPYLVNNALSALWRTHSTTKKGTVVLPHHFRTFSEFARHTAFFQCNHSQAQHQFCNANILLGKDHGKLGLCEILRLSINFKILILQGHIQTAQNMSHLLDFSCNTLQKHSKIKRQYQIMSYLNASKSYFICIVLFLTK